jgi:hypothetical protein
MILPVGAKNFEEAMQMGSETYHHLKVSLHSNKLMFSATWMLFSTHTWIIMFIKQHKILFNKNLILHTYFSDAFFSFLFSVLNLATIDSFGLVVLRAKY